MPAWQVLIAAPGAVLITSFALSASAAEPPRQLRAGTPMPNHPKVSANSTTEMTTTTLTSTTAKGPQTPCGNEDESCFIDTDCCSGRCSFTFRCAPARRLSGSAADGDLPAVTTSIGDLPEVSASSTTETTTTALTSTTANDLQTPCENNQLLPCRNISESCYIDCECCSGRCSLTRRCAPVLRLRGSAADGELPAVTTSIGDLPEVSANATTEVTTTTLTSTTANGPQTPCGNEDESCFIDTDCCSGRCSLTLRCAPVRRLGGSAADGDLPAVTTSIGDLPEVSASSTTETTAAPADTTTANVA